MAGRKPKGEPMTTAEMIEAGKTKRATSKIYKAESEDIKDESISLSINNALSEIRKAKDTPQIRLDDIDAVRAKTEEYLRTCAIVPCFPSMSGLAMALGCTRRYLNKYMEQKSDTETGKFLIQIHDKFADILSENSLRNNANSIVSIFLLKSLFGYKEVQGFEFVKTEPLDKPDVNEIASRAGLLIDD